MSFDDPFANVDPQKRARPSQKGRKKKFDQPLNVSRRDVYKATGTGGSVMHGKHYQLTTRLPPEVVDDIREWAAQLGMTQQDLQRYCFYRGLQALAAGERPEFEEVIVRKKLKPPD
ncbi:MAG: hypothetical protein ACE5FD_03285 [Anaerolineae bacterium]